MTDLKSQSVWICWQYETDKDGRPTKIPYNAKTGGKAMSNNRQSWSDYQTAFSACKKYDGMGFMFADGICGIDIDGADGHTKSNPLQNEILQLFEGTYIERSPSGSGFHILFRCDMSRIPKTTDKDGKTKLDTRYYQKNKSNELECYFSGLTNRYFTYTGDRVSDTENITDKTEEVLYFLEKYMYKGGKRLSENIIDIARKAKNGTKFIALYDRGDISAYNNDESSADIALCNMLAFYLQGDINAIDTAFRGSALYRQKWERTDYREATISNAIALCGGEYYKGRGRPRKEPQKDDTDDLFTPEVLSDYLTENGVTVRLNDVTQSIDIEGMQGESQERLHSNISAILYSELQGNFKRCNIQIISAYLDIIASRNRYNPVIELLNSYEYDGRDYLSELYSILHIADNDELSRTLIKKWLWQSISLLHNDETEPFGADGVLVITGRQGIGKTSLFRKLALKPQFFKEGVCVDFRDKDTYIRALSCWIAEMGEIESTFRSDIERLKAFITNSVDEYRRPYGRDNIRALRRTSLCGTCNSDEFLLDRTGNRRFLTVQIDKIDLDRLRDFNAVMLWKQIEQMALNDIQGFRLTQAEQKQLAERNANHEKKLKGENEIEDILNQSDNAKYSIQWQTMTVTDFKQLYADELRAYSAAQIGKVLDKMGYNAEIRKVDGKTQRLRVLPKRNYNFVHHF
ncbi:MAG: hypothetical protein IJW40_03190 [Clostridia bacterium]|nr:hypothetical protein [Clostridia bacterium]